MHLVPPIGFGSHENLQLYSMLNIIFASSTLTRQHTPTDSTHSPRSTFSRKPQFVVPSQETPTADSTHSPRSTFSRKPQFVVPSQEFSLAPSGNYRIVHFSLLLFSIVCRTNFLMKRFEKISRGRGRVEGRGFSL